MTTSNRRQPLTVDQARDFAADLIRALAGHCGDSDAVDAEMLSWDEELGSSDLGRVSLAAVQMIFTDCLTPTPLDQVPADRLALLPLLRERLSA